jgi:hypothetical protein
MSCPVSKSTEGDCPVTGKVKKITIVNEENQFEAKPEVEGEDEDEMNFEDYQNLTPDEKEFRKLQKTMSTIKKFYSDGTKAKKSQFDFAVANIEKLKVDIDMGNAQLEAFNQKTSYMEHLKQKEYIKLIKGDIEHLQKQCDEREEQRKGFEDLYTWSQEIVKICEWLELNLEDYCLNNLNLKIKKTEIEIPELNENQKILFSKGLDEIMHNLTESQDFFEASVDGRLLEFQYIEAEIIKNQLEVLKKFPEDSKRREYFEEKFTKDLKYCESRINSGNDSVEEKKREKVLKMHQEFLKLLRFFRFKWNLLNEDLGTKQKYDPKFTQVYVIE